MKAPKMLRFIFIVALSSTSCLGFGFVVKPRQTTLHPSTALGMAKGGVHGKKSRMIKATKKKRKSKKPSSPGKHRKTSKRDAQSDAAQTKKKSPSSPVGKVGDTVKMKPSGPPWQVMGKRDAKKNVELEKVRRDRIRKGLDKVRLLCLCM